MEVRRSLGRRCRCVVAQRLSAWLALAYSERCRFFPAEDVDGALGKGIELRRMTGILRSKELLYKRLLSVIKVEFVLLCEIGYWARVVLRTEVRGVVHDLTPAPFILATLVCRHQIMRFWSCRELSDELILRGRTIVVPVWS